MKPLVVLLSGCLIAGTFAGCQKPQVVPDSFTPPAIENTAVPEYGDLVNRYNERANQLDRLWARTTVEMRWVNAKGKVRREKGDGKLIFQRPLDTALTVEVLGDTKLWAGSDALGFWVFDLHEGNTAYYGSYGKPLTQPLPLPVQPEAVPYLLGLMPIDPNKRPAPPEVELIDGYAMIEPPGLNLRMLLHPDTARPVRIDLTDPTGKSVLICRLTGDLEVDVRDDDDVKSGNVTIAETADLLPVGEQSRMIVTLSRATTSESKIKSKWFRFDTLNRALKPEVVVDLNAP